MLSSNQLRQKYLDFFSKKIDKPHVVIPSSSLVPENDPTTLFTSSGMQPLVPYLLGEKHPMGTRLVDSQKSFRSQDIEEVGDNRHTTFFEMLGNWSLGDYFKKEQLRWVFTFLTKEVGLDPHRLFVTVFRGSPKLNISRDSESVQIWQQLFSEVGVEAKDIDLSEQNGLQGGHIFYYDEKKNWWSRSGVPAQMPAGEPGGPDSEIFYDFGAELGLHEKSVFANQPCHVNCDCGRFMEIGNSVFMQYQKQTDDSFKELSQQNVDFGGGFERILAAANQNGDIFKTDLFVPIIKKLEELSGKSYDADNETCQAMRVIADHVKASVMLVVDGVVPANKAQGYFERRLIRRAIGYADKIGITNEFIAPLVKVIVEMYGDAYPSVATQKKMVVQIISAEEKKYRQTLFKGLRELRSVWVKRSKSGAGAIKPEEAAKEAFYFFQSWGIPVDTYMDMTEELPRETIIEEFNKLREEHAATSRTASVGMFKGGLADQSEITTKYHTTTHLLHAALRQILGTHVQQKGSNITAERLRFDFSNVDPLTTNQQKQVETQVNEWIAADLPVGMQKMAKQDALKSGAVAFFIEKYPDEVSVYTIGKNPVGMKPGEDWISRELCGGPHVTHTGTIGKVKIIKEQSVSAGVRRIYMELAK